MYFENAFFIKVLQFMFIYYKIKYLLKNKDIEEKSNKIELFTESFHLVKGNNKAFYEDGLGVVLLNILGSNVIRTL